MRGGVGQHSLKSLGGTFPFTVSGFSYTSPTTWTFIHPSDLPCASLCRPRTGGVSASPGAMQMTGWWWGEKGRGQTDHH